MKDLLMKLVPESRKLRVLLVTLLGFVANILGNWLTPDQIELIATIVMVWLGGQSLADAGLQGKVLGEARRQRKEAAAYSASEVKAATKSDEPPTEPAAVPETDEATKAEDSPKAGVKKKKRAVKRVDKDE